MGRNIVSISGGKDSGATYLFALQSGIEFEAVFADTGNEHPITLDYIREFSTLTGGPPIKWVKADFASQIKRKRSFIAYDQRTRRDKKNRKVRWSNKAKRRSIPLLDSTGNPFVDLCLYKGRFPSTRRRFCSEELKHEPIYYQAHEPLLEQGLRVVSWQGVRADESPDRALLPYRERVGGGLFIYRPILHWSVDEVLAIHKRHNIPLNPLYTMGCSRVGCMPCIHAGKEELRNIAWRFPEVIDRIQEWERIVGMASKRGVSTFFSADKTPGPHKTNHNLKMPGVREVVKWSRTVRGGRQYDLMAIGPQNRCSSVYGLCE